MLTGLYVSTQDIIRECFRDYKYKYQLPTQDAIEWAIEAVELIGAQSAYRPAQAKVTISNYRGMLPCDLHDVNQVAGSFDGISVFPMRHATNTFQPVFNCESEQLNAELNGDDTSLEQNLEQPIGYDLAGNPVFRLQNGTNSALPDATTDTGPKSLFSDYTYNLNDSYIFTNYKNGYIFMAYEAIPIDEDGFPLIPDNRRFKEAVKSFIRYKVDYIMWRSDEIARDKFEYSEREWLFYVGSASNAAKMPDKDVMQGMMNQIKLVSRKMSHDSFFRTLGGK